MSRSLLFYVKDLKAAGVLDAPRDLKCTLQNDMFSFMESLGFTRNGHEDGEMIEPCANRVVMFLDTRGILKARDQGFDISKHESRNAISTTLCNFGKSIAFDNLFNCVDFLHLFHCESGPTRNDIAVIFKDRDMDTFCIDKDIHPVFARSKFERATQLALLRQDSINSWCSYKKQIHPYSWDMYDRIRPTLQLASRILTDRRYIRFWASLVHAKEMGVPRSGSFKIKLLGEEALTPDLVRKTHLALLEMSKDLVTIVFTTYKKDTGSNKQPPLALCCPDIEEEGRRACHIELNTEFVGALLEGEEFWNQLTPAVRTQIMFQLLELLLHEVSHAFASSLFAGVRQGWKIEPVIDGDGLSAWGEELGYAWSTFFVGGPVQPNGLIMRRDHSISNGHDYSYGLGIKHLPSKRSSSGISTDLDEELEFLPSAAIPISWMELVFTERWFQRPYPVWDLALAPRVHFDVLWEEGADPYLFIDSLGKQDQILEVKSWLPLVLYEIRLRETGASTSVAVRCQEGENAADDQMVILRKDERAS